MPKVKINGKVKHFPYTKEGKHEAVEARVHEQMVKKMIEKNRKGGKD